MKLRSLSLMVSWLLWGCAAEQAAYTDSPQYHEGRFRNAVPTPDAGIGKMVRVAWNFFNKPDGTVPPGPVPTLALTREQLLAAPDLSLFRLGHSTVLLKMHGLFWLTDPVFSPRASGVQWLGPKRFHPPPISIADLPPITGVVISHNHYDHLDRASILELAGKTSYFLTPLGVGDQMIAWGVDKKKVRQLDWWQATDIGGVRFVATPSQHSSGRGIGDTDKTLWASWAILEASVRVFFSGDTGYFDGFKAIGDRYGPFDITLVENGAYGPNWSSVHMQPEQTLQAHLDLRGKWLLPIHNGTFDLGMHHWQEPFERITALATARKVHLSTPCIGERVAIAAPHPGNGWWRDTP